MTCSNDWLHLLQFESMECEELLLEADKWLAEVEKKFSKRNFTATVVNLEGVSVLVTRYIQALNPPEEVLAGGEVSVSVMS